MLLSPANTLFQLLLAACFWLLAARGDGAENLPPRPAQYFNDYAAVISPQGVTSLDRKLRQYERDTSNQLIVAVYPKLESPASVQDYTWRIAEAWKIGQKDRRNGAVLFVFIADRKMFIQVGYGLEGVLPDAVCKRIIAEEITPHFKTQNYEAGLTAGVDAMIKAARGEYTGSGKVAGDQKEGGELPGGSILAVIILVFILSALGRRKVGTVYSHSGRRGLSDGLLWGLLGGMMNSRSRGSHGGFGSGGGGGGFSAGGGSFGGGGAGGDW